MPKLAKHIHVQCDNCGTTFSKKPWQMQVHKDRGLTHHFCNRDCHAQYKHRKWRGTKRSHRIFIKKLPPIIQPEVFNNEL